MFRFALPLLVAAVQAGPPELPQRPDSITTATAYADSAARRIVEQAREHRHRVDRSITRYRTIGVDRLTVGLNALRRERMLVRRETALRIDWRRDERSHVEVVGSRLAVPIALPDPFIDDDVDASDLMFDPSSDRFFLGVLDSSFVFHPFADNSEIHYRYASGDTTTIRLQDGRTVLLLALEVKPRIRDAHHFEGTIWVDADSHAMVRAVVRLAEPYDLEEEAEEDGDKVPGFLKPIRAELRYLTIEYGLWSLHWWLPRLIALEGVASAGSFLHVPVRLERKYGAYEVEGDTTLASEPRVALTRATRDSLRAGCRAMRQEAREARREARRVSREERTAADEVNGTGRNRNLQPEVQCDCTETGCHTVELTWADSATLLTSEYLPPSIWDNGSDLMTQADIDGLTSALRSAMPQAPLMLRKPTLAWGPGEAGLLRYNRVEGLSVGARATMDAGWATTSLTARLGAADLHPGLELAATRTTPFNQYDFTAYHRLAAMNPEAKPLAMGNSLSSLVLGQDDGEYFRASGVEIERAPASGFAWYSIRLYAEAQRAVAAETNVSLPRAFDSGHAFRPNRPADRADQAGAEFVLRHARGLDPVGWRWGLEARLNAETGTMDFGRAALTARLGFPLPGPLVASLEGAGGSSLGEVPVQSGWFLGGPATLRGYPGAALTGNTFWRGRAEIGTSFPGARVALFGDAGWAGDRSSRRLAPEAWSLGIGGSLLDGIARIDLARALQGQIGWRLHLYLDAVL
jgi:hypothetical protein